MKLKCVLFDLDGTLLNTNHLVLESLKHTIRETLGVEVEEKSLYKYFGIPLPDIMRDFAPDKVDTMVDVYRSYNRIKHDDLTLPFPGAKETLLGLKQAGISTAVVTSKIREMAVRGLNLFGLMELIDICVTYEDTEKHKPEPDPVLKALELFDGKWENGKTAMVGDSPFDLMSANRAGVVSVAVDWSMHPREVLLEQNPKIWLSNFEDILKYV